jgi:hypothetical protein
MTSERLAAHERIVNRAIECTPEHWDEFAFLVRVRSYPESDQVGLEHSFRCDRFKDLVEPTDELMLEVRRLHLLAKAESSPFRTVEFKLRSDGDGWSYDAAYTYD